MYDLGWVRRGLSFGLRDGWERTVTCLGTVSGGDFTGFL